MQRTIKPTKRGFLWEMKHNRSLYLMSVPALLLLLAFAYLPMGGIYMAFTKFNVKDGIFGSPFVVFQNDSEFLSRNPYFWKVDAMGNQLLGYVRVSADMQNETITIESNDIVSGIRMETFGVPLIA